MLYLMIWALCAIAAAVVYQRKGRPWLTALLVGAILGPFGVALALLTRPNWDVVRRCSRCREMVGRERATCPACGAGMEVD